MSGDLFTKPLTFEDDLAHFDSGVTELDTWLREHALNDGKRNTSRTFIAVEAETGVIGFYSLSAHKVSRDHLPKKFGRGGPQEVPAVLIAKLALAHSHHGHGLGEELLVDALLRIARASLIVGARYVVVDPVSEKAAHWYQKQGFVRIADDHPLVLPVSSIVTLLPENP